MAAKFFLAGALLAALLGGASSPERLFAQEKEGERKGAVVGMVAAKGGYWIEVKADGEEKARRYFCGSNKVALKAVKDAEVGSRIRLEWRFEEVFRVVAIEQIKPPKEKQ